MTTVVSGQESLHAALMAAFFQVAATPR